MTPTVHRGQQWRERRSKRVHFVVCVANRADPPAGFKPTVVYQDMDGTLLAQPEAEFVRRFERLQEKHHG